MLYWRTRSWRHRSRWHVKDPDVVTAMVRKLALQSHPPCVDVAQIRDNGKGERLELCVHDATDMQSKPCQSGRRGESVVGPQALSSLSACRGPRKMI
eukprot:6825745-Pyramimonas_sp.AAC.1